MNNINSITIGIWDLQYLEEWLHQDVKDIWVERLRKFLSNYYFAKVSQGLNTRDYNSIEKLESILELINSLE